MAFLPTYPEPHSATPGADYTLREQVPHGDLNQIVTNQRNLWNVTNSLKYLLVEENVLGNGNTAHATVDTGTTTSFVTLTHGDSTTDATLAIGDVVSGVAGPFRFQNLSATNASRFDVVIDYLVGSTATYDGTAVDISLVASLDGVFCVPFRYVMKHAGRAIIILEVEAATGGNTKVDSLDSYFSLGTYRVERPL